MKALMEISQWVGDMYPPSLVTCFVLLSMKMWVCGRIICCRCSPFVFQTVKCKEEEDVEKRGNLLT